MYVSSPLPSHKGRVTSVAFDENLVVSQNLVFPPSALPCHHFLFPFIVLCLVVSFVHLICCPFVLSSICVLFGAYLWTSRSAGAPRAESESGAWTTSSAVDQSEQLTMAAWQVREMSM